MTRTHSPLRRALAIGAAVGMLALAGCGDDDDVASDDDAPEETSSTTAGTGGDDESDEAEPILVTGVDYAYENLPATAEVGTELTFTNGSDAEVHEMVVLKIADGEERSLSELLQLPEAESEAIAQFRGVTVAFPGEPAGFTDGSLTLAEPGRYAVVCFIPTGADPQDYRDAIADPDQQGPPEVDGGPPHFVQGMVAEIEVS